MKVPAPIAIWADLVDWRYAKSHRNKKKLFLIIYVKNLHFSVSNDWSKQAFYVRIDKTAQIY